MAQADPLPGSLGGGPPARDLPEQEAGQGPGWSPRLPLPHPVLPLAFLLGSERQSHETCCCPNIDTMLAPRCPDGTVAVLATEQGTCPTCARGEGGTEVCVRVSSVPCSPPMMPARSLVLRETELAGKWGRQLCSHKWCQQRWRGLPQTCW